MCCLLFVLRPAPTPTKEIDDRPQAGRTPNALTKTQKQTLTSACACDSGNQTNTMSDAQAQLAEVDALIAASPDDPSLLQLRDDLLQLIALEEQEKSSGTSADDEQQQQGGEQRSLDQHMEELSEQKFSSKKYTAQSTFTDNIATNSWTEAPDLGTFQPVITKSTKKSAAEVSSQATVLKSADEGSDNNDEVAAAESATATEKKKKQKKSSSDDKLLSSQFELPNHLIQLDSDTPAQKQKKQRAAKALKSKFRSKQKEMEHTKRANDWKSFSSKAGKKKKKLGSKSIFSTEEGVNAKVGVISGGGLGRTMTGFSEQGKHKF